MEYDNTARPPPAPTEEATTGLEEMIKRRIAEARWDDVVRLLPPPAEVKKRQLAELDDTKAQQVRAAARGLRLSAFVSGGGSCRWRCCCASKGARWVSIPG